MPNLSNNNCVEWRRDRAISIVTLRYKKAIMKLVFLFCLMIFYGWLGSDRGKSSATQSLVAFEMSKDSIDFTSQVQPILVKNCSPCHFTGGKMYDRMPFDKHTTVINHEKGILKRIKGDENMVIKTFIDQNKTR